MYVYSMCVGVCVCVHAPYSLEGSPSCKFMHLKKKKMHTVTVTCTHTQASTEVSCDHAAYLHSRFKETVYKAVVDGGLARCS